MRAPRYLITDGAIELIESADTLKNKGKKAILFQGAVSVKAIRSWVAENLGGTLNSKRTTAYKEFKTAPLPLVSLKNR